MQKNKYCLWCKVEFVPRSAGQPQKYCSKLCKKAYEKEVRKIGIKLLNLESPILNAGVKDNGGEQC